MFWGLRNADPLLSGALLGDRCLSGAAGRVAFGVRRGASLRVVLPEGVAIGFLDGEGQQGTPTLARLQRVSFPPLALLASAFWSAEPSGGGPLRHSLASRALYLLPKAFCVSPLFLLIYHFVFLHAFWNPPGPWCGVLPSRQARQARAKCTRRLREVGWG